MCSLQSENWPSVSPGAKVLLVTTDASGAFAISGLVAGTYTISCVREHYIPLSVSVEVGLCKLTPG